MPSKFEILIRTAARFFVLISMLSLATHLLNNDTPESTLGGIGWVLVSIQYIFDVLTDK